MLYSSPITMLLSEFSPSCVPFSMVWRMEIFLLLTKLKKSTSLLSLTYFETGFLFLNIDFLIWFCIFLYSIFTVGYWTIVAVGTGLGLLVYRTSMLHSVASSLSNFLQIFTLISGWASHLCSARLRTVWMVSLGSSLCSVSWTGMSETTWAIWLSFKWIISLLFLCWRVLVFYFI